MVTTVTVTTVTTIAAIGLGASLSAFAVVLLIGFLVTKELVGVSPEAKHRIFTRSLNIAIVPLVLSLAVVVCMKVAEILSS